MGWKYKLAEKFIHHRNYLEKGLSMMYWVIKLGQFWVMGEIYFKLIIPEKGITTLTITIGVCLFLLLMWFIGLIWDKEGIFIIENEWTNKRNQFVSEMRKKYNIGGKKDG